MGLPKIWPLCGGAFLFSETNREEIRIAGLSAVMCTIAWYYGSQDD
jgi:hypothetical protein